MKKSVEIDPTRMRHMLEAAQKIRAFTEGKTRAEFEADEVLSLAVVRLIEIIGEAASQVTDTTRARHPQFEWQDIVGMRNRVIHGYFQIARDIIWNTINDDIPTLITQLESVLEPPSE